MLWIRLRFLAVATLAVGIASGGASVYVRGSQEPAPKNGQPVSKRPTTTTAADPTAGGLEECNRTAGDRRAAGKAACAATGHAKSQGLL